MSIPDDQTIKEKKYECAKCGSVSTGDLKIRWHRFPLPTNLNKARCNIWAKYCFPNEQWKSLKFQKKLYTENKMLCEKHFKHNCKTKRNRLQKGAELETINQKNNETNLLTKEVEKEHVVNDENIFLETHSVDKRSQKQNRLHSSDPIYETKEIPNEKIKLLNCNTNKIDKISSYQKELLEPSIPYHLPLHITIPQNTLATYKLHQFIPSTSQPKGKIVIQKSKMTKYVPSSEPPILITVPSLLLNSLNK